jgi:hypothetical protein
MRINPKLPSKDDVIVSLSSAELHLMHSLVFELSFNQEIPAKLRPYYTDQYIRTFLTHINEASNLLLEATSRTRRFVHLSKHEYSFIQNS